MTEAQWLVSEDPMAMLRLLERAAVVTAPDLPNYVVTDRKLRLLAAACWRLRASRFKGGPSPTDVRIAELAESLADGVPLPDDRPRPVLDSSADFAPLMPNPMDAVREMCNPLDVSEEVAHATFLREIVGNPFRPWMREDAFASGSALPGPKLNIVWLSWLTPQVLSLAQAAYDERGIPCPGHSGLECCQTSLCPVCLDGAGHIEDGTLDPHRLAVLSDVLEEAGCPQTEPCEDCTEGSIRTRLGYCDCERCKGSGVVPNHVLAHLRSPGPHVRGCHVLDLIVGRS